ncbi:phosphoribosylformimino-5-aminoimidazole carboxamide ribotide isomerase [Archaeoglobus profundus DSM 5631]|uniref:1-(5-phosphoribosyl)-5-[(5-phosphoribosylamino)methylideneamino] imidazole-4-carboxamide isomerase n=1 Tax=Archaeoglobus profundus (strain DSM 5631 / JCM 9629 / NBRC 100127 / Av18) TaxID=572546 RepID=D2RGQ4_ARCPA|nr:phosphoribosylformimino-5-aminoimidazole carboxamide ribotide isomerase [Archaeoglobus profundus DSM 5631]
MIPAVDLKGGKVVRLVQGRKDKVTIELEDPIEVAKMWIKKGARVLHVIDLDGAFEGRLFHEDVILEIARIAETQAGGGIRDLKIAERLLNSGVERVIFGTLAVRDVRSVKTFAKKYPNRVMIAVDSKKGKVVVEGWVRKTELTPIEVAKLYEDCEVSLLYTNVDVEGLVSGVELEKIREVVESTSLPVYVAGGISSPDDVRAIKKCGAVGVIIGSALYTGKVRLEDLLGEEE